MKFAPCPCGKIPTGLFIVNINAVEKWKYVAGDCCGAWETEFRAQYKQDDEMYDLAIEAWNEAPRGAK